MSNHSILIYVREKQIPLFVFLFFFGKTIKAQDSVKIQDKVSLEVYTEVYYAYDFNKPANHVRLPFFNNYNRHNEVNLNFGLIKILYSDLFTRGNFAMQAGTYPQYEFSYEPPMLRSVSEANIGVKLAPKLWLDAGILPSHLGFENSLANKNLCLTRSLLAEGSPDYLSGLKLTFQPQSLWNLALLFSNGWQRTTRIDGNQTPWFGSQITYSKSPSLVLNWSTFWGSATPDSLRKFRFLNDFYAKYKFKEKIELNLGFDIGFQQAQPNSSILQWWYCPLVIAGYSITDKVFLAARIEYYSDKNLIIMTDDNSKPFQTLNYSLNVDWKFSSNVIFRIEGRFLDAKEEIFRKNDAFVNNDFFITNSMIGSFK